MRKLALVLWAAWGMTIALPLAQADALKWTNLRGQTIEAAYVVSSEDTVTISMNGKTFVVKLAELTPESQNQAAKLKALASNGSGEPAATPISAAGKLPALPLSTNGAKIVDAKGAAVVLRGVSWFGMETETHVPHGLWARGYKETLRHIRELGFNLIRLPFSVNALRSNGTSGIDFNKGSNRDLKGKTPLEAMDMIIEEAQLHQLLILLDCHRLNDREIPELWYGDGYTEKDWIDLWRMLARRYRKQGNVIGADLKNEPHGRASWGTGDLKTDWRLAAERAGNAILKVNPDWLIVVEGIEKNVPGQKLPGHWWGGNLEGVRKFPVRLEVPRKLVYSPHEYGAGVHHAAWFDEPNFPSNLLQRWDTGFYYIVREDIAPVLVGEFGGRKVDSKSKEGVWQRRFVEFLEEKKLGFIYWCWNPNGGDTGGLVKNDWKTLESDKLKLLKKLLKD